MELSKKELKALAKRLQDLEWQLSKEWFLSKISGGFVHIEMFNYDDEIIDIEIKSGVQSDVANDVVTQSGQLDRKTLEIIKL